MTPGELNGAGPLTGISVLSVEQAIAAPLATRHLFDLGASVTKIESPSGDFARTYDGVVKGLSAHFVWANRGKTSIVLDLKDDVDRERLEVMIGTSDVFVQNLSLRAARSLGIDAERLVERHPGLIAVDICGYGQGSSYESSKAYDLAIQAEAGAFSVTGDASMSKVGFPVADISAGMYTVMSVLAALVERQRTGRGRSISVSMLDCLAEWLSAPMYAAVYGEGQPPRTGRRHHGIAPYGTYPLADGTSLLIAVQNDVEWAAFLRCMWDETSPLAGSVFASNQGRLANVEALEDAIVARFGELSAEEVHARLERARITKAEIRDLRSVWQHPALRERERFMTVQSSSGPIEMLKPPFMLRGWEVPPGFVPDLGMPSGQAGRSQDQETEA